MKIKVFFTFKIELNDDKLFDRVFSLIEFVKHIQLEKVLQLKRKSSECMECIDVECRVYGVHRASMSVTDCERLRRIFYN